MAGGDGKGKVADDGPALRARGGTEMMRDELLARLPAALKARFNIVHSRVRELDPARRNILVLHDTWDDPEARHLRDPQSRRRFAKLVFVSHTQFESFRLAYGIRHSEAVVLKNAIAPIGAHAKPPREPIRFIYHTTPHRGLELLVPAFEHLCERHRGRIRLDVYSSFSIYGWPQRDQPYEDLFARLRAHPAMAWHGAVPNTAVREALKSAHVFAYPNIWPETSCIAAMEAMSAGCAIVCPAHAALPETTANFALQYPFTEELDAHAHRFAGVVDALIRNFDAHCPPQRLAFQKAYADAFYNWDARIGEWIALLESL
jgi:glycosyltransferase involved in cell wall biosynthesis